MNSDKQSQDEIELERLLGQAHWPGSRSEQLTRLTDVWLELARRRHLRRIYGWLAAASVLLVVGLVTWQSVRIDSQSYRGERAQETATQEGDMIPPVVETFADGPVEARIPSLFERVIVMTGSATGRPHHIGRALLLADKELREETIMALAADSQADIDGQLGKMRRRLVHHERALWAAARDNDRQHRVGAARLLARIGSAQSLGVLIELSADPATHEAALTGLCRLASTVDLAQLARIEPSTGLRRALLTSLLERRTEESVALFLSFVIDPVMRSDSLRALASIADPPVDLLLTFLESPRKSSRLAAARSLARLPDEDIALRLGESVERGIGRQEALVALLLSSNAQAADILNRARHDLYLVASVQAAEFELHLLSNPERR